MKWHHEDRPFHLARHSQEGLEGGYTCGFCMAVQPVISCDQFWEIFAVWLASPSNLVISNLFLMTVAQVPLHDRRRLLFFWLRRLGPRKHLGLSALSCCALAVGLAFQARIAKPSWEADHKADLNKEIGNQQDMLISRLGSQRVVVLR